MVDIVYKNEREFVEYKSVFNDSLTKEIVSFLNTHLGTIYIGITNEGKIIGVQNLDETLRKISDIITDQILPNPQSYIKVVSKEINEKEIIQIEVKKGNALYYIRKYGRSTKGCYMRIGSSCKSMTEEQIENLYSSYILLPEKQMNDISVLRNDFTFVKFKNYLTAKGIHYNEFNFLNNFSLITSDGKFNLLGELLADENKISIKVAVFK